jgi:hypothetical protein
VRLKSCLKVWGNMFICMQLLKSRWKFRPTALLLPHLDVLGLFALRIVNMVKPSALASYLNLV